MVDPIHLRQFSREWDRKERSHQCIERCCVHQIQEIELEREQLLLQFNLLNLMDAASFNALMAPFFAIPLSAELPEMDWIDHPQQFSEQLTAYLWSQHEIDKYHKTAQEYQEHLQKAFDQKAPAIPRWTIVVIGRGMQQTERPLFRRLMPHGTLFTQLNPAEGLDILLAEVNSRAQQHPLEYGHWYIDGSEPHSAFAGSQALTTISYDRLVDAAKREFSLLHQFTSPTSGGGGGGGEI